MTESERYAWLQLAFTPYVGSETFVQLLAAFGTPQAALNAPADAISQQGKHAKQAAAKWHDTTLARQATDAALTWAQQDGCRLMLSCDDDYPALLAEGITAPPVLFLRGNTALLHQTSVGIVGSRHATPQAMRIAQDFGRALSEHNITVISGMAAGIDTAAHIGALCGAGSTIAVWGTGIDRIYPASNQKLARDIADKGLIISEFPLETRPLAGNFPRRNRIIAAQSHAVLVVEAALESGSLITARQATEMGRDVMAIPGSIDNPHSKGCHKLIKEGAKLVECLDDILSELGHILPDKAYPQFSGSLKTSVKAHTKHNLPTKISTNPVMINNASFQAASTPITTIDTAHSLLQQMGYGPVHPDTLAANSSLSASDIYALLTEWELEGIVASLAGGRYQRIK
ncbi:DNA-processing protein DprA [Wielerella bovis]|uniref:DNA-processing protein DprA n=1 Tax=Wielerella bovis TaxID=2917790 RepID=UPI0020187F0C|nr:DNA-processing protein DprA [Wielerella bovis]ULJ60439.1 DNA-processing protein DprA [Wielerella bovis]